jgi:hypothetical protein
MTSTTYADIRMETVPPRRRSRKPEELESPVHSRGTQQDLETQKRVSGPAVEGTALISDQGEDRNHMRLRLVLSERGALAHGPRKSRSDTKRTSDLLELACGTQERDLPGSRRTKETRQEIVKSRKTKRK